MVDKPLLCKEGVTSLLYHLDLDTRKPVLGVCEQQRRRPACAPSQSDQHLCYSLIGKYHILTYYLQIFNFLVSVAEETSLSLALLETPKTGFMALRPI